MAVQAIAVAMVMHWQLPFMDVVAIALICALVAVWIALFATVGMETEQITNSREVTILT